MRDRSMPKIQNTTKYQRFARYPWCFLYDDKAVTHHSEPRKPDLIQIRTNGCFMYKYKKKKGSFNSEKLRNPNFTDLSEVGAIL